MSGAGAPIAVFGSTGQLGMALLMRLGSRAKGLGRRDVDLTDTSGIDRALDSIQPSAVINASVYSQVDRAESERELAFRVNADAPGAMARYCAARKIPFVHYSTDYVFDGSGTAPWREDSPTRPLNAYGESKLAGERAVLEAGGPSWIFRTSWVHAPRGTNFVRTMLRLGSERTELKVVSDQKGAPTYAEHLAQGSLQLWEKAPPGVYHLCGGGETSWHDFAEAIFSEARANGAPELKARLKIERVHAIPSSGYPTPARRPLNSRLDPSKARGYGVELPSWRQGLSECMARIFDDLRTGREPLP